MDIGDQIYFKQKDLYVNQFEAELHKGELIYKYRFCRENGIWQDKLYNEKIRGRSLEGEVLETDGEKLKLHYSDGYMLSDFRLYGYSFDSSGVVVKID